jgi:hypothetical protein
VPISQSAHLYAVDECVVSDHADERQRNGDTSGNAGHVAYSFETRRFEANGQIEHYDRDFQMDTAFYRRTGFTGGTGYGQTNFYPAAARVSGSSASARSSSRSTARNRIQGGDEYFLDTGIRASFTRQGNVNSRDLARQGNVAGPAVRAL